MAKTYDVGGVRMPRPFKTGRLGHLGLYVRDLDASLRFYRDLLGFRHTDSLRDPTGDFVGHFLTYGTDHHSMVLISSAVGRARSDRYDRGVTINQLSFQVSTLQEVVDAHTLIRGEGVPIWRVGRDVPGSNWAVYFHDPDGHTCELFYGMEQIGWDRRSKPEAYVRHRMAEPPALPQPPEHDEVRSIEQSDVAGSRSEHGHRWEEIRDAIFDVGGVRLPRPFRVVNSGPIAMFVADLDMAVAFYRDRLGLAVTEEVACDGSRIVYLRTGTEHHTIALVPATLRSTIGLGGTSTLAGYGVQVGSHRQLVDAAAFLAAEGIELVDVSRAVQIGIGHSVHVLDPDGHPVRLYAEMEQVGTSGVPMHPSQRRSVSGPLPSVIDMLMPTMPNATFQGPLG